MQERYAYYPGCLASLSQKELDSSTRAVCAKLGVELVELESMTCCGAGDIHEAKPDYYLHLNARILGQAEALGIGTILTICNVCTLNLRQANKKLKQDADELERVNRNLAEVGAATYSGDVDVRHLLWKQMGVNRHEDAAGFGDCEDGKHLLDRRLQIDADAVSAAEPSTLQTSCQPLHPVRYFAVGQPLLSVDQGLFVGRSVRTLTQ